MALDSRHVIEIAQVQLILVQTEIQMKRKFVHTENALFGTSGRSGHPVRVAVALEKYREVEIAPFRSDVSEIRLKLNHVI